MSGSVPVLPPVTYPLSTFGTYKPFSDFSLQQAVDRAVANLPADHTFALVAHADNDTGASLSAVVKVGDEWKVEASVVKGWNEPFKYGAEVVWSR